ncbi:tyrosine-type recombinase/integrase [Cetobacterium sp. SF1]|uniref:tyrosine-type recombinase/integrase n=1 Tax=unclassified Cetobacterium TaxID=2630983 RepID=UPI003CF69F5A
MNLVKEYLEDGKKEGNISSKTVEMYRVDLEDFKKFIGKIAFEDVSENEIIRYIEFLKSKYQEKSIVRKYTSLRSFYKYLLRKKIIDDYPMDKIVLGKCSNKPQEILEWTEINGIYENCDKGPKGKRDRVIISLLRETGIMITEILEIKISDLEKNRYEYFTLVKGGDLYLVELSKELEKEIKEYIEEYRKILMGEEDSDYLFYGISRQNFRARFMKAAKKAGIEREVSPNMIKNTISKRKEFEIDSLGNSLSLMERIKEQYMKIGIGDD